MPLHCPLPPAPSNDVLCPLNAVNRLSLKQMHCLRGREKDAIASSDITKAPFVIYVRKRQNVQKRNLFIPDVTISQTV